MSVCCHSYTLDVEYPDYDRCLTCSTYHSRIAPPADALYTPNYWSHESGHSTIAEQVYNIDTHVENGKTKAESILDAITVEPRNYALEIGCAPGVLLQRLQSEGRFFSVVGIEMQSAWDAEMREVCGQDARIIYGEFPAVTCDKPAEKMDLIVACDVLEHSHEPWPFLVECYRLLRKGGQFVLMVPLAVEDIPERMFAPEEHVYIHSFENLTGMLRQAGLRPSYIGRWCPGHEIICATKGEMPEGRLRAA